MTIEKECSKHGLTKFSSSKSTRPRCSKCLVESVTKRRRKIKVMAVAYLGGQCQVCGYNKCVGALDFHHKDPLEKDLELAIRVIRILGKK